MSIKKNSWNLLMRCSAARWMEYAHQFLFKLNHLLPDSGNESGRAMIVMINDKLCITIFDHNKIWHTWEIHPENRQICRLLDDAQKFYELYLQQSGEEKLND